jgi:MFS family permease
MLLPIRSVFTLQSVMLGAYLPRLPDVMQALGLSEWQLGVCLIAAPIGTLLGFSFSAKVVSHLGLRRATMVAGPLAILTILLPANASTATLFFLALVIFGVTISLIEVAYNAKASEMEIQAGKRLMSQCHGFWSIGLMIGAPIAGYFSTHDISLGNQFQILSPILAILAFWAGSQLPADQVVHAPAKSKKLFSLPTRAILPLCIMPAGIMAVEGGMLDWSGVFIEFVLNEGGYAVSAVYFAFAGTMAAVRMVGDWLADRYGARAVILASCLSAAAGMLVFVTATNITAAVIAAGLLGAGVATVYPLALSSAGKDGGRSAEENIASIALMSFVAFLLAPPIIGLVSDLFGLRVGLGVLVLSALLSASLVRAVPGREAFAKAA